MKVKQYVSTQLLILALAGLVLVFMIQAAKAQNVAQSSNSTLNQQQGQGVGNRIQTLEIGMPQKSLGTRILESTSLSYYQQFLGPTMSGNHNETYNVFQEGLNQPGTGRAPLQSFHAANLRYQINPNWAVGASLAVTNGYTEDVVNEDRKGSVTNTSDNQFYNARAYVVLPAFATSIGTLYSTVSYEAPTSVISKQQKMTGGYVISESFALKVPNVHWQVGVLGQYYRAFYNHKRNVEPPPFPGGLPTPLQTVIVSGGPYVNYRFNDSWMLNSLVTLDWDQRGPQTDSREFNNNLDHRGRVGMSYFPKIRYLTNIGVFAQGPLKARARTTALGADFSLKF